MNHSHWRRVRCRVSDACHQLGRITLFCSLAAVQVYAASPNGFVVWSEGDHENRELKYQQLQEGTGLVGQKKTVCQRGTYSDIECVISFDGKYVAFARQLQHNNCCYDGPGDYHMFGNYDVYIVRVDGSLPATPKKVGHGYWPSWGDDSDQPNKTLYYSWVPGSGRSNEDLKIMKVTVRSDGSVSSPVVHIDVPENSGDGHMQCSPNGRFVAYRTSAVKIYDAQTKQTSSSSWGGCHPSWCADSYWLMWARANVGTVTGAAITNKRSSGLHDYHYGSSADMKWAIGRIGSSGNDQNTPHDIIFYPLRASKPGESASWGLNKAEGVKVGRGTWCDIHSETGPSIGLSIDDSRIGMNESTNLSVTLSGGASGTVSWSVSGGGSLSNTSNSGATFTSDGMVGTFTITAQLGDLQAQQTVSVYDPSSIHVMINAGGPAVGEWESDASYASGGDPFTFSGTMNLSGCTDPAPSSVYSTVRHWNHSYAIDVPNGDYLVRIHFADATSGDGRAMDYTIEGTKVLTGYNIVSAAGGSAKGVIEEFDVDVSDGTLNIAADQAGGNDVFDAGIEAIAKTTGHARPGDLTSGSAAQPLRLATGGNGECRLQVAGSTRHDITISLLNGTVVQRYSGHGSSTYHWRPLSKGVFVVRVQSPGSGAGRSTLFTIR